MKTQLFFAFSVAALVAGCGSNNSTTDMAGDMASTADPVKPSLATTQIERMGRATINVAVTNPFNLDYTKGIDGTTVINGGTTRDMTRDMHSKDSNVAGWKAKWTPIIAKTLAIYDGVDGCGNQFGSCATAMGCSSLTSVPTPAPNRYDALAGVLADDQLYMDTTKADCSFYLAVEAAQGLAISAAGTYCGGRLPTTDVVDVMYTAAGNTLTGFAGVGGRTTFAVTDGVTAESTQEMHGDQNTFPFLGSPNQ